MLVPSIFEDNAVTGLFHDVFNTAGFGRDLNSHFSAMNMDVQEFDQSYQLEMELPGYKKEDIHAELKDGYLVVEASHNQEDTEKDENGRYIRRERYFGKCQRRIYVGEEVKREELNASFEDGILKIMIPKKMYKKEVEDKQYIPIA
ncbi:Hsp20/alpha crystallin family protein [Anaerosporobacter faecicola]|uniref:Hsp20/alpha crystallin family protein n=1 Tax=Anaerosporobacter faecicola TaxID=2718714 RepID=UPI00143AD66F|nr:Hsp20/alpha crystallin family protein [Anaerosporobacter faecicola]